MKNASGHQPPDKTHPSHAVGRDESQSTAEPSGRSFDRRHVAAWVLYDFANSVYPAVITATIFSVYYARAIVGNEEGAGDLWWGRVVSVSVAFVAVTSPILGSIADRAGLRKRLLFFYTYVCIGAVALFTTLQPGMVLWGFTLAVLANIGFEGALVYYNAYLSDIAPAERQGFVSGLGFGVGYAGSVAGLLMALPLVSAERFDLTWLAVAGFFALFSLPSVLWLPADSPATRGAWQAAVEGVRGFTGILRDVLRHPPMRRFLVAYFFYVDGVLTVIYFAGIFASTTLGFEQEQLIYLFLVVQVSALVGALGLAKPTDTWGPKRVVTLTLVLWTGITVTAYFVESQATFFVVAVLAGTGLGAVQAASRSLMASLIPRGKEAEMFGFYAFCGKSSSIMGPFVFGEVSYLTGGNQRAAVLVLAGFFLAGLGLLQRVPDAAHDPS